ncbi:MAG: B12-binding domain-containing radical SAM protein [Anaerolineae bacterium]|jgi:anaerobic magnesium-protoporphyrin IX monomethyl ester cyclase
MAVDILLCHALVLARDPVERRLMTPYFPLGILYLAATLREAGYTVALYDGCFEPDLESFERALDDHQPRLVGITALSTVRANALELAARARRRGLPVIVGGSDPTGQPEHYLAQRDGERYLVDVVVGGEGEETILELLPALLSVPGSHDLAAIRGIAYRRADEPVRTGPRPLRRDVDAIPLPARDLADLDAYQRAWRAAHGYSSLSIIASRGCPFECAWCQKSVFGRSCRLRHPEAVAQELALLREAYHPDQVRIVDDVVGIDRRWVGAFRDAVVARGPVVPFECLSRVDLVDREVLTWLKEAGCVRIQFGAESGSQKVLDAMHKGTRVEQIHTAAALCRELGIEVYFFIMVGYPGEEWGDIRATVRLLRKTRPTRFSSTIAYPLPGTPFHEQVRDRLAAAPDWDYTAENRMIYRGRYSTRFYRWVQRLLQHEWQCARLRAGELHLRPWLRLRAVAGLWLTRMAVWVLRLDGAGPRSLPSDRA